MSHAYAEAAGNTKNAVEHNLNYKNCLNYLDFVRSDKGRTSGSRIMFVSETHGSILLHKPHPQKDLKTYQIKQLADYLEQEGLI